ncbi:MAG TPA: type IX secretion system outer membrane channel protein PorV, partial [Gillisia sp.]|nr:type IX secretion system outer membrane channel protein PorV [Gillisia sp.]
HFMKIENIITSLLLGFVGFSAMSQQLVRPVITGAPFLQIVPDARAGGLGESGVSTLPDAYAQFHNPAKFLFLQEGARGFGMSYIPRFIGYANDIFYANAGYYQKLNERSAISGSLTYFNYGNVDVEEQMGDQIINQGSFAPNEFAIEGAYSLKLNDKFGMSVTGRYIRSDISDNQYNSSINYITGQAVSVDVSGYYTSVPFNLHQNRWTLGFNLKNIGSKLKYADNGFDYFLPTYLKVGGGYHIASSGKDNLSFYAEAMKFLVPATDDQYNLPTNSAIGGIFSSFTDAPDGFSEELKEILFSFGSELKFHENFTLRAGYLTQHKDKGYNNHITVGAGLNWNQFMVDFAYQSPITDYVVLREDKVLKLSLTYKFDKQTVANPIDSEPIENELN